MFSAVDNEIGRPNEIKAVDDSGTKEVRVVDSVKSSIEPEQQ